jgi:VanZ family protein
LTINSDIWRGRLLRYAPIILWIGVIFYLSSDGGSMNETSRFIRPLLHFLFPSAPDETIQFYHGIIRKSAHFFEYAVLGFLVFRASTDRVFYRLRYILPVMVAAIIALHDEANQSFITARTGSLWDVALDLSGAVVMVIVLALVKWPRPQVAVPASES